MILALLAAVAAALLFVTGLNANADSAQSYGLSKCDTAPTGLTGCGIQGR